MMKCRSQHTRTHLVRPMKERKYTYDYPEKIYVHRITARQSYIPQTGNVISDEVDVQRSAAPLFSGPYILIRTAVSDFGQRIPAKHAHADLRRPGRLSASIHECLAKLCQMALSKGIWANQEAPWQRDRHDRQERLLRQHCTVQMDGL